MLGYLIVENVEKNIKAYTTNILEIALSGELINFEKISVWRHSNYDYIFPGNGENNKWWIKKEDIRFIGKNGQLFLNF